MAPIRPETTYFLVDAYDATCTVNVPISGAAMLHSELLVAWFQEHGDKHGTLVYVEVLPRYAQYANYAYARAAQLLEEVARAELDLKDTTKTDAILQAEAHGDNVRNWAPALIWTRELRGYRDAILYEQSRWPGTAMVAHRIDMFAAEQQSTIAAMRYLDYLLVDEATVAMASLGAQLVIEHYKAHLAQIHDFVQGWLEFAPPTADQRLVEKMRKALIARRA